MREDAPIIFCANKIDLRDKKKESAMSLEEIINIFNLEKFSQDKYVQHSFRIFEISAKTGENVEESMEWLFGKVIGSKEKSKIKGVLIYSSEKKSTILEIPFVDEVKDFSKQKNIAEIIDYNSKLLKKSQSTMQYYEQDDMDVYVFAQGGFLCIIITEKEAEYNSVRITGQSILNVVSVLDSEGELKIDQLKWVIKESFGA